jgi:hypothetical protein
MSTAKKPRSTATARKTANAREPGNEKKAATKSAAGSAKTLAKSASRSAPAPSSAARLPKPPGAASEALQGGAAPAADAPTQDSVYRKIAEAAYYRAERRGFAPGGEELDWFEAEAEIRGFKSA